MMVMMPHQKTRHIDLFAPALGGGEAGARHRVGRRHQEHPGQAERHRGVDEAGLDRRHRDAGAEQPRAQALEIGVSPALAEP